jgi:hypothetical protein
LFTADQDRVVIGSVISMNDVVNACHRCDFARRVHARGFPDEDEGDGTPRLIPKVSAVLPQRSQRVGRRLLTEMRRLRRFIPPHQKIHHDSDDGY